MLACSIIVPVFKAEAYLDRCVNSILSQTMEDFELILVDDGSPDRCGEMCDAFARADSRIRVLHQTNAGQAVARNRALDLARGEFFAFVDSDDYIHPQMLEVLLSNARKHSALISVGCCKIVHDHSPCTAITRKDETSYTGPEFLRHCLLNSVDKKPWILCDKIFHRSCFDRVRMPEGRIYEDNSVVYKLLYEARCVVDCSAVLYYYYQNENSTMNQSFRLKHLDWLKVLEEMVPYFEEKKDTVLIDKMNRSYLFALTDLYQKVKQHLNEPSVLAELKVKLKGQYLQEKKRYPITIKTHPHVMEILYPGYAKCYWTVQGILSRFHK